MKREDTIDFHIRSAWYSIARMYNQKAIGIENLTASVGFVLINIDSLEGTPATKIAPLMGLESRSLTRMLKGMEENHLIFRKRDKMDRRSVRVFLTEKGKTLKGISVQIIKEFNGLLKEALALEEWKMFFVIFKKIGKVIDNYQVAHDFPLLSEDRFSEDR